MKKLFIFVLFFFFISTEIFSQITEITDSVSIVYNRLDENGQMQGHWKKYWENGKVAYEGFFIDNKPVGEYKRYFTNGRVQVQILYDDKGEYGAAKAYDDYGRLIAEGFYKGTEKDSVWKYYSSNKYLAENAASINNTAVRPGQSLEYLIAEERYVNGVKNGKAIDYYPNGVIARQTFFVNGLETGVRTDYYASGDKKTEVKMFTGKFHGAFNSYWENGNLDQSGTYQHNLREGTWLFYSENGRSNWTIEYLKGEPADKEKYFEMLLEEDRQLEQNKGLIQEPEQIILEQENRVQEYGNE